MLTAAGKIVNNFNNQKPLRKYLERAACSVLILFLFACQLLCLPGTASAEYKFADKWTAEDTAWQSGVIALKLMDWSQTRYIAKHPNEYYEINPILGRHPSTSDVDLYFAGSILLHTAIAMALPPKATVMGYDINPRRIFQAVQIGLNGVCVAHNLSIGIGFDF